MLKETYKPWLLWTLAFATLQLIGGPARAEPVATAVRIPRVIPLVLKVEVGVRRALTAGKTESEQVKLTMTDDAEATTNRVTSQATTEEVKRELAMSATSSVGTGPGTQNMLSGSASTSSTTSFGAKNSATSTTENKTSKVRKAFLEQISTGTTEAKIGAQDGFLSAGLRFTNLADVDQLIGHVEIEFYTFDPANPNDQRPIQTVCVRDSNAGLAPGASASAPDAAVTQPCGSAGGAIFRIPSRFDAGGVSRRALYVEGLRTDAIVRLVAEGRDVGARVASMVYFKNKDAELDRSAIVANARQTSVQLVVLWPDGRIDERWLQIDGITGVKPSAFELLRSAGIGDVEIGDRPVHLKRLGPVKSDFVHPEPATSGQDMSQRTWIAVNASERFLGAATDPASPGAQFVFASLSRQELFDAQFERKPFAVELKSEQAELSQYKPPIECRSINVIDGDRITLIIQGLASDPVVQLVRPQDPDLAPAPVIAGAPANPANKAPDPSTYFRAGRPGGPDQGPWQDETRGVAQEWGIGYQRAVGGDVLKDISPSLGVAGLGLALRMGPQFKDLPVEALVKSSQYRANSKTWLLDLNISKALLDGNQGQLCFTGLPGPTKKLAVGRVGSAIPSGNVGATNITRAGFMRRWLAHDPLVIREVVPSRAISISGSVERSLVSAAAK